MKSHSFVRVAVITAALGFCVAGPLQAQSATGFMSDSDLSARTTIPIGKPSEEHRVSFEGGTDGTDVIKQVKVKPGDVVKVNDILMSEDTDEATAQLKILQAAAAATGEVEEADASIKANTALLKAYSQLSSGNTTGVELINAQRDLDVAVAKKKQAQETQQQRQLEMQRQQIKLDHMVLKSPVNGIVRKVGLFEGEVVNANTAKDGAVYIVSIDPLWVELPLDARWAAKLHLHDKVQVAFQDTPDKWQDAEVVFLDPVVEFASQTEVVRISVPNSENRPAGLPMMVKLPQGIAGGAGAVIGMAQP